MNTRADWAFGWVSIQPNPYNTSEKSDAPLYHSVRLRESQCLHCLFPEGETLIVFSGTIFKACSPVSMFSLISLLLSFIYLVFSSSCQALLLRFLLSVRSFVLYACVRTLELFLPRDLIWSRLL